LGGLLRDDARCLFQSSPSAWNVAFKLSFRLLRLYFLRNLEFHVFLRALSFSGPLRPCFSPLVIDRMMVLFFSGPTHRFSFHLSRAGCFLVFFIGFLHPPLYSFKEPCVFAVFRVFTLLAVSLMTPFSCFAFFSRLSRRLTGVSLLCRF